MLDLARRGSRTGPGGRPLALRGCGVGPRAGCGRRAGPIIRAFRARLGARSCYVADLDAIQGGAVQRATLRELAQLETGFAGAIMVDAGAHTPESTFEVLAMGASQVVIGLETLRAFTDLRPIVRMRGRGPGGVQPGPAHGSPILHPAMQDAEGALPDALSLASQATDTGVSSLVLLDLASIGTGCGTDLGLIEALRKRFPEIRLLAGGGVLARRDLDRMREAGCDGALVASAIHAGTITAADLADLVRRAGGRSVAERLAVGGGLPVVLLDLQLQQRQVGVAAPAELIAHLAPRYWASISAVLFWIGSRAQSRRGNT